MKVLNAIIGFVVLIFLSATLNGYVLTKLWSWFVAPTFHLPVLQIAPAIGIALIVGYLTHIDTSDLIKKDEDDSFSKKILKSVITAFFKPLFALFLGWIILQFM